MLRDVQSLSGTTATTDRKMPFRRINMKKVPHKKLVEWLVNREKNPELAEMAIAEIVERYHERLLGYAEKEWGHRGSAYDLDEFVTKTFLLAHKYAPQNELSIIGIPKVFWGSLKFIIDSVFMDRHRQLQRKHDLTTALEKMLEIPEPKVNDPASPNYRFPNKRYTKRRKKKNAEEKKEGTGSKRAKLLLEIYYKHEALSQSGLWFPCAKLFADKLSTLDKKILGYGLDYYDKYTGIWYANIDSLENHCQQLNISVKTFRARRSRLKQRWFDHIMSFQTDTAQTKPQIDVKKWPKMCYYNMPSSRPTYVTV